MNLPEHKVFCDTSFFFASLFPDDSNHEKAMAMLEYCTEYRITLCTTWDIISETVTLLRYRASYGVAVAFLDKVKPSLAIIPYDDSARTAAEKIFKKLSKDKKISFCDTLSYVVITHMLDNMPCLSFDRDFKSLGLTVYP